MNNTLQAAMQLHSAGNRDAAAALYRTILCQEPDHANALHLLAVVAEQDGRCAEAARLAGRAATLRPDSVNAHQKLAQIMAGMGDAQAAEALLLRALILRPTDQAAYDSLASFHARNGQSDMAALYAGWAGNAPHYRSQYGQDAALDLSVFFGFEEGVFVDIGAHDGVSFSNTHFLENRRRWSGICIEPNPTVYEQLRANRSCACVNACIAEVPGTVSFLKVTGWAEMYSGIIDKYDARQIARIEAGIRNHGGTAERIDVVSETFSGLAERHGIEEIHYVNIDTEGAELDILRSIDFTRHRIHCLTVECNWPELRPQFDALMDAAGFDAIGRVADIIYVNRSSRFHEPALAFRQRISDALPYVPATWDAQCWRLTAG